MPNFTVELVPAAENGLADAYLRSGDVAAVVRADAAVAAVLSADPTGGGRHVSEGLYRLTVPPLVYLYEVDLPRRHVTVVRVRTIG